MMPIRFPTEAANDPHGKLDGLPESTGEDDATRTRPESSQTKDRATNEPRTDDARREDTRGDDKPEH